MASVLDRRKPLFTSWALNDACNLSCSYCGRGQGRQAGLPHSHMLRLVREMAEAGVARVNLTGGEPLLHPACVQLVDAIASEGMAVTLSTNGLLLPRHLERIAPALDHVTISLDGRPAVHDSIRGEGTWKLAVEGARAASGAGVPVSLHTVVTSRTANPADADAVLDVAREVGCQAGFTVLRVGPGMSRPGVEGLFPSVPGWRRTVDHLHALQAAGDRHVQNSTPGLLHLRSWPDDVPIRCCAGIVYARVESDGRLYACGDLVRESGGIDLQHRTFKEAFELLEPGSCQACWCDTRVEMNLLLAGSPRALWKAMAR